ncbi:MAG: hypothetical protein ACOYOA_03890 [Saprospiraceae bacterium]
MQNDNITLSHTEISGENFYKISNVDSMRPFFMSIVSDSNHWMFIASNGGLSCGRKDAEHALFPYYTDDKITGSSETTGSKTIFWIKKNSKKYLWEPFSERGAGKYLIKRNLYKSKFSNQIIFEEINVDLEISFQYQWCSSNEYGFVRKSKLENLSSTEVEVVLLDGLQNILPFGVGSDLQNSASNLADAYKRTELIEKSGLGIFALSAIIVDKAEPSEALKANIAWSIGIDEPKHLLSSLQISNFRNGAEIEQETDIKGEKGAYFVVSKASIAEKQYSEWMIVLNVNQDHSAIVLLSEKIKADRDLWKKVQADINSGTENLLHLTTAADGMQCTADDLKDTRHYSNVLFNIMRGGIFDNNYDIEKWDFSNYLQKANRQVFEAFYSTIQQFPDTFPVQYLLESANKTNNLHFIRLSTEYLPLKFSRRHGDPSRPWNKFSINTRSEIDGSKILDYQGNWRDIFQNWEALAFSYPEFIEGMIFKFLNGSTFDGYNPYRVTKGGFEWETIEPDNPWSYIGYWGDHQVIYLLKFLEFSESHRPGHIQELLCKNSFVYANVPYKIKPYREILRGPKDTIEFDHASDVAIHQSMEKIGSDGSLLTNADGQIYVVSFCEKILATVLSKLSNLVPDGGIWMNTQRPEWNDANNALVGNGLSMVTLCYLRRFLAFFQPIFSKNQTAELALSAELYELLEKIYLVLEKNEYLLTGQISDKDRKTITDALGIAGSDYRTQIYAKGFSGKKKIASGNQILNCFRKANIFLEHAIIANKRHDDLYHTYNLLSYDDHSMQIGHLSEMLEGQVAVLSAGFLSAEQSLNLLDALKQSSLYRTDQLSYILYPNKNLPKFLNKNTIPQKAANNSSLLRLMMEDGTTSIITKDIHGDLHFNGNFRNANDLDAALSTLDHRYADLIEKERSVVLQIFEEVFCHKEFTGRSGTFFGYEGLGSIYWHMVSKLLLAVQETCYRAIGQNADKDTINGLRAHFYEIYEGIGVHKPPHLYGAFPTDPYSHTPFNKGVQQPGMTGQVKEDIISRFAELGIVVNEGKISIQPLLLRQTEFLTTRKIFEFQTILKDISRIEINENCLVFTFCQVPFIYHLADRNSLKISKMDNTNCDLNGLEIDANHSYEIFKRTGSIQRVDVYLKLG